MNLPTLSAAMNHSTRDYTQERNYSQGSGSFPSLHRRGSVNANYNGELYENYGNSILEQCHASTSASTSTGFKPKNTDNACTARRSSYYARPCNRHVEESNLQFSSPPSCQITTFRRDLPHANHASDDDFEIYGLASHSMGNSDTVELPLISLSNFSSNWQDNLEPLSLPISHHHRVNDDRIYPAMKMGFSGAGKLCDALETIGSILSDDEDSSEPTSPEDMMRPYPPFLHIPPDRWTTSPESVDADLDNPGLDDASETSSLSPPYEDDVELRHRFLEPEDDDGMTSNEQERQQQQQQRYHPLDKYPSTFPIQLYNKINGEHSITHPHPNSILPPALPTLSDSPPTPSLSPSSFSWTSPCSSLSSSPLPLPDFGTDPEPLTFDLEPLEPTPPASHFTHDPIVSHQEPSPTHNAPGLFSSLNLGSSFSYPPFYDSRDDDPSSPPEIPCSPSRRRRSMALPLLGGEGEDNKGDCDSLGLQQFSQFNDNGSFHLHEPVHPPKTKSHWLSLPGCDADDDLIPMDLASKNYVPDASIVVHSTPLIPNNGTRSLLMWEPSPVSSTRLQSPFDLNAPIPRSPSPGDELAELEQELASNPNKLAELAPEGAEEEVARLVELRRRQRSLSRLYSRENYTKEERERERERCRELSTLLRIKLRLDERSKDGHEDGYNTDASISPRRSASVPTPASPTSNPSAQRSSSPSPSTPRRSNTYCTSSSPSSKHKITSMAQLVANMVFHRQQEAMKKHSPSLPSTPQPHPSPSASAHVTSAGPMTSPKQQTMRTPRSPLRQVTLPVDLEMTSELEGVPEGDETDEIGPLSPLVLATSPLSCHFPDIAPASATNVC